MLWLLFPELFSFSLFPAAACLFCSSSEAFSLTSDLHAHSSTFPWDEKPEDPMHPQRQTNHSSQQKAADLLTLAAATLHAAGCPMLPPSLLQERKVSLSQGEGYESRFQPREQRWIYLEVIIAYYFTISAGTSFICQEYLVAFIYMSDMGKSCKENRNGFDCSQTICKQIPNP